MKSLLIGIISVVFLSSVHVEETATSLPFQNSGIERIQKKSLVVSGDYKKYASSFNALPITLYPGTTHREDSSSTALDEEKCKSVVYRTLQSLPDNQAELLEHLTLFYTNDGRRGLSSTGFMILRCLNITERELIGVMIHEMGHVVDMNFAGFDYPS